MGTQNDFWRRYESRTPFFDKGEFAANGTLFSITRVEFRPTGKYGAQWILHVTRNDSGEVGKLSFPDNDARQERFSMLQDETSEEYPVVAKIRTFHTDNGTAFDIAPPFDLSDDETDRVQPE